jgi:leucyl/phenylalanyl-tRNA--protein transferase
MPVYLLDERIIFPSPALSDKDGLLAIGGDLSSERLIMAYTHGIFPWYEEDSPILWWSPDPRTILLPSGFKCSKSLRQTIKRGVFSISFDKDFEAVISACSRSGHRQEEGTWITPDMIAAYTRLHEMGYAHSVEVYQNGMLAGGLYGISLGKAFFGESMFFHVRDASKVALAFLVDRMNEWGYHFIDAQQQTSHLQSLGAKAIPRQEFLEMLRVALTFPTITGKW